MVSITPEYNCDISSDTWSEQIGGLVVAYSIMWGRSPYDDGEPRDDLYAAVADTMQPPQHIEDIKNEVDDAVVRTRSLFTQAGQYVASKK